MKKLKGGKRERLVKNTFYPLVNLTRQIPHVNDINKAILDKADEVIKK